MGLEVVRREVEVGGEGVRAIELGRLHVDLRREVAAGVVGRGVAIENDTTVGARCKLETNAYLTAYSTVEDDVFVGGGCGVYEGTVVRERAVLAAGVILTRSTRVYDLVNETVLRSTEAEPLEIPAGAVVVPGSRAVDSDFGRANGLALSAPCIVKYRDASTDASTTLEDALR